MKQVVLEKYSYSGMTLITYHASGDIKIHRSMTGTPFIDREGKTDWVSLTDKRGDWWYIYLPAVSKMTSKLSNGKMPDLCKVDVFVGYGETIQIEVRPEDQFSNNKYEDAFSTWDLRSTTMMSQSEKSKL